MQLSKEQIERINKNAPYNQGVFFQPYGIPVDVKEPVIYCRYETGGYTGGSCFGGTPRPYSEEPPKDRMRVLDLVLAELCPSVSFLKFREIERLIETNEDTEREYYGNSTEWKIEYIPLSKLYQCLNDN